MRIIKIHSFFSTGIHPEFDTVSTIEISNSKFAEGGFGELYHCIQVNDKNPNSSQVIKIFTTAPDKNFKTIQALQKSLRKKHKELTDQGKLLLIEYKALQAIPQFSFEGVLDGVRVRGYTANDLTKLGYTEYKDIQDDDTLFDDFYNNYTISKKYKIAYDLVKAMNLLRNINFMHADIKEDALFIDLQNASCAIIDFDSGAVLNSRSSSDEPTTIGSFQEWLAPEISNSIGRSSGLKSINVTLASDYWSIAFAIYYIIFGHGPYYFMTQMSPKIMRDYLSLHTWPYIDISMPYINEEYIEDIESIQEEYKKVLPDVLKKAFETTFNDGYSKAVRRYSYEQWEQAFKSLQMPPKIISFSAGCDYIEKKQEIVFSWNVEGASRIYLDTIDVSNQENHSVTPDRDKVYILTVYNEFELSVTKELAIKVSKEAPEISSFISNAPTRIDHNPIDLIWNIPDTHKIKLFPNDIDVTNTNSIEVFPIIDTIYTLEIENYFGVKNSKELLVEVSKKSPKFLSINTSPNNIRVDKEPVELYWEIENAEKVILQPQNEEVLLCGSKLLYPMMDTTYSLIATTMFGISKKEEIKINVSKDPPRFKDIVLSKTIRIDEEPVELFWEIENAEKVLLLPQNEEVPLCGSKLLYPMEDTTYNLVATTMFNIFKKEEIEIGVSKDPPRFKDVILSNAIRTDKDPVELRWMIENAQKVILQPQNEEISLCGSKLLYPMKDTTYNLVATSLFGMQKQTRVEVKVSKEPSEIILFNYQTIDLLKEAYELHWVVNNVEKIKIVPKIGEVTGKTKIDSIDGITEYTLITETLFGVKNEKKIRIAPLFTADPNDDLFENEPDENLFNLIL